MEDFKGRLSRLMKEKNFNNSSLGREIEKVPSAVKKWVDGEGMPELKAIDKIAKILQVSPAYLLYGVEETPPMVLREPEPVYGVEITKDELIEFYKWKAEKANNEAETATKQVERLKSTEVDAK